MYFTRYVEAADAERQARAVSSLPWLRTRMSVPWKTPAFHMVTLLGGPTIGRVP